jgi:hypothetical protein
VREHLSLALKTNLDCSVDKRIETLVGSLMNARDEIEQSKKEFHSKEMKELKDEINEILEKYGSEIG